jgi:hypothetical protein
MKNRPEKLPIIGLNLFFNTANRPKTSPDLNFCFMKIAHQATCNDFVDKESSTKWVELSIREHYDSLRPFFLRFDCTKIEETAIQLLFRWNFGRNYIRILI